MLSGKMKNKLLKHIFKKIKDNNKRFLSLFCMAFLGVGFFTGIQSCGPDMLKTLDNYYDENNVYDIEIISNLGLTNNDIEELKKINDVKEVIGTYTKDTYLELDNKEFVLRIIGLNNNINKVYLSDGKLPSNNSEIVVDKLLLEENNLKILFNRSFTNGYLFSDKVMNISSSNHQGLEIGKVIDITPKKIKIKLSDNLYQEDGLRFKQSNKGMIANFIYNEKNLLINKASKGDIIYLDNKINLKDKDILEKTSSPYLDKEILSISEKKIKIDINIEEKDNNLSITFQDKDNNKVSSVLPVEVPLTRNTTKEEIKEKISKLGNTPFIIDTINIDIKKNIFVNMKEINNIRRELTGRLVEARTKVKRKIIINDVKLNYNEEKNYNYEVSVLVRTKEQLEASISQNVDRIYTPSIELYNKYKDNNKVYLRLPRVVNNYNYDAKNILVTELGGVYKYKDRNIISDYYLNVVNNYSIKYLLDNNVKRVTLSPEINYNYLDDYIKDKVEIIVYGKPELMITKSCPIKEMSSCPCTKEDIYYLEDIHQNKYLP